MLILLRLPLVSNDQIHVSSREMLFPPSFLQVPLHPLWGVERWHSSHPGHHRCWLHLHYIFNGQSYCGDSYVATHSNHNNNGDVVWVQICEASDLFFCCQVLALCHIALGQQLNLHWLHKVMCRRVSVLVLMCVGGGSWEVEVDGWVLHADLSLCCSVCAHLLICLRSLLISWTCPEVSLDRVPGGLWKPRKQPGPKSAISKPNIRTRISVWGYSVVVNMYFSVWFSVSLLFPPQIGVTVALLTTIAGVISVNQTWGQEWDVIPISLQVSRMTHSHFWWLDIAADAKFEH